MVIKPPKKGDIIWASLSPTKDRGQSGTRPVVVLTPYEYNKRSSLLIACPLTTKRKGYPFEVELTHNGKKAAILVDQVKSLDWKKRIVSQNGTVEIKVINQVLYKLSLLLEIES